MRTKGQALRDKIDDSLTEISRLIPISHLEEDYAKIFKVMGGEMEKFLKSTVFQTGTRKKFFHLIEDLRSLGVQRQHIDALHIFRDTYNGYKHQPNFSTNISDAKIVFENTRDAIDEINAGGFGGVNQPYIQKSKRLVWFAGWDDYVGGMTECDLFIPDYNIDFPLGLEHFNIGFEIWDAVVQRFTSSGELKMGKQYVSERAYNVWSANVDLIGVGAFNGDIAEFTRELSKGNSPREKNLLSFLKRANDSTSVKCAIVFSLFDSLRQNAWQQVEDLRDEILLRASYDYGINIESNALKVYIDKIDFRVIKSKRDLLQMADDILWVDELTIASSSSTNSLKIFT